MNPMVQAVVGVLAIGGALLVLGSAVLMVRERDAFSRINCLSPATGMGLPMIVLAVYLKEFVVSGVTIVAVIQSLVTLAALLVVSSVASNVLARGGVSLGRPGAPVHPPAGSCRRVGRALEHGLGELTHAVPTGTAQKISTVGHDGLDYPADRGSQSRCFQQPQAQPD